MLLFLAQFVKPVTFSVVGSTLTIDGTGIITQDDVRSNCDISSITSIIINNGPTEIRDMAFYNFVKLTTISLPASIQIVISNSTRACLQFESWILDTANQHLELDEYGALYYKGRKVLIRLPPKKKEYEFPSTIKTISDQAFQGQRTFRTMTIPNTVDRIEVGIIYTTIIKNVIFEPGSKLTYLMTNSFAYTSIESITLPASLISIGVRAFGNSYSLKYVIFEEGSKLESIASNAFYQCNLQNFSFPPMTTTVESNIFNFNKNVATIHIPASLVNLDQDSFKGCSGIVEITVDDLNPKFSVSPPATLTNKNKTEFYFISPTITTLTLPAKMTNIGTTLLQSCDLLTEVNIEDGNLNFSSENGILYNIDKTTAISCSGGITVAELASSTISIGEYCFFGLKKLYDVKFNSKMRSVDGFSFAQTQNLTTLTFPASLNMLKANSFESSSINYVIFSGDGPQAVYSNVFRASNLKEIHFGKALNILQVLCFTSCTSLVNVTLHPECPLKSISYQLFQYLPLTSFTIPKNIERIEEYAFQGASKLTTLNFASDSKLTTIDTWAFAGCPIESIVLPRTVTTLAPSIWTGNSALKSLVFESDSVLTSFGTSDWLNCTGLVSVDIPSSITIFDPSAFSGCTSLISLNVDSNNANYSSDNGIIYTKNYDALICCPNGLSSATVLSSAIRLASKSFYLCTKLKTVTFMSSSNLLVIEELTFYTCTSLESITFPDSLTTIKQSAFLGCSSLSRISFADYSVCNLDGESIFEGCKSLVTVSFGQFVSLSILGSQTFKDCVSLERINIPPNCTIIDDNCFENCKSLSEVVFDRHSKLATIGDNVFIGCVSLTEFCISDSFSVINSYCFGDAPNIRTVIVPSNMHIDVIKSDSFIEIPLENITFSSGSTVDVIEDGTFMGKNLKSFTLNCPVVLKSNSFKNCVKLSSLSIDFVTSIGNFTFSKCTSLSSVQIPNTCKIIGNNAFEGCSSLADIVFEAVCKLSIISKSTFSGCSSLESIIIPRSITKLCDSCFANCLLLSSITFESDSLLQTIESNSFSGCEHLRVFTIPDSFTALSSSSFGNAPNIETVNIPDDMEVSTIKPNTFSSIPIKSFVFGRNSFVLNLESSSFMGSTIEKIEFPNFPTFGSDVFKDCTKLTSASFRLQSTKSKRISQSTDSVSSYSIPDSLFDGCAKLKQFNNEYEIVKICDRSFCQCSLLDYHIPDSVTFIGDRSFEGCSLINRLPSHIEHIGNMSFMSSGMKRILFLPPSVSFIGKNAFSSTSVHKVRYCGSHDLSSCSTAYDAGTLLYATSSYPSSFFCGLRVFRITSCDESMETQIKENDILLSLLGPNCITLISVMILI